VLTDLTDVCLAVDQLLALFVCPDIPSELLHLPLHVQLALRPLLLALLSV